MSAHTPEPWGTGNWVVTSGPDGVEVKQLDEVEKLNSLHSAAPDLLAALELYVGENKKHTERERKDIALAAIAKAKGGAK